MLTITPDYMLPRSVRQAVPPREGRERHQGLSRPAAKGLGVRRLIGTAIDLISNDAIEQVEIKRRRVRRRAVVIEVEYI